MTAKIVFPGRVGRNGKPLTITRTAGVEIESSFKILISRAEITLPRNVIDFDRKKVREVFRVGDPVVVYLGYDGFNVKEFEGYISAVSADVPVVIKCEDEMYKVRRLPANYSAKSVTLQKMLSDLCPGYEIDALENVPLGGVRFSSTTVGKVLEELQSTWNLYTYMRDKVIVCGKYYSDDSALKPVKIDVEKNLVDSRINYKNKEDVILKIKAKSILVNGKKIEVELGDEGGDTLELSYYNITVKAELERKVKEDYENSKRDGYDGTITAYGRPVIRHGMKVDLISNIYPDRNGIYYVEAVNKSFSRDGFRQQIKLGGRV